MYEIAAMDEATAADETAVRDEPAAVDPSVAEWTTTHASKSPGSDRATHHRPDAATPHDSSAAETTPVTDPHSFAAETAAAPAVSPAAALGDGRRRAAEQEDGAARSHQHS